MNNILVKKDMKDILSTFLESRVLILLTQRDRDFTERENSRVPDQLDDQESSSHGNVTFQRLVYSIRYRFFVYGESSQVPVTIAHRPAVTRGHVCHANSEVTQTINCRTPQY